MLQLLGLLCRPTLDCLHFPHSASLKVPPSQIQKLSQGCTLPFCNSQPSKPEACTALYQKQPPTADSKRPMLRRVSSSSTFTNRLPSQASANSGNQAELAKPQPTHPLMATTGHGDGIGIKPYYKHVIISRPMCRQFRRAHEKPAQHPQHGPAILNNIDGSSRGP